METTEAMEPTAAVARLKSCLDEVEKAVRHPPEVLRACLVPIIGGGHGLLEGEIGVAKTTTVKAISRVLQLEYKRIDCTPDLFPSDVVGGIELDQTKAPAFFRGPALEANVLHIEEINRASPKAQAGSISIMEERQIDIRGTTYSCREPFIVFATQNPIESTGVFPLPEAQLDRFIVRVQVPYPEPETRRMIVERYKNADHTSRRVRELRRVLSRDDLGRIRRLVDSIQLGDYVTWICDFCEATRPDSQSAVRHDWSDDVDRGAGPRALRDLAQAARALATIDGEPSIKQRHLREAALPVLRHRVKLSRQGRREYDRDVDRLLRRMLDRMPPR